MAVLMDIHHWLKKKKIKGKWKRQQATQKDAGVLGNYN